MTNTVVTAAATALKAIAAEPEAAQTAQVAHTVEATSGWLADFTAIVDKVGGYVWGAPLITCILVTGLVLTCILRFTHLFNLKEAFRIMFSRDEGEGANGEVSQFGALCTALSATIGTGNIVGVATAIGTGGPGALFWMAVTSSETQMLLLPLAGACAQALSYCPTPCGPTDCKQPGSSVHEIFQVRILK